MLSKDENELLTRVGPGTPMGNLMRSYWFGAAVRGCGPTARPRFALLGENLAFRNSSGRLASSTSSARTGSRRCGWAATRRTACASPRLEFDTEALHRPDDEPDHSLTRLGTPHSPRKGGVIFTHGAG